MQTIYFIIPQHNNHQSIIKKGNGASEVLFYLTAKSLSSFFLGLYWPVGSIKKSQ